jgi:hypothetical protein
MSGASLRRSLPLRAKARDIELAAPLYTRALVVFGGGSGVRWLRWLKPGFRHCFVAVDDGIEWLTVDSLLHRLEIRASGLASAFDLAAEYRRRALAVIEVVPAPVPLRRAPLGLFTCVETAKRLLGIRARWILTPWQLHGWLRRRAEGEGLARPARTKQENNIDTRASRVYEHKPTM